MAGGLRTLHRLGLDVEPIRTVGRHGVGVGWNLHSRLAKLLPHKPWDWPIVQDPDDPPPWRPNESAQARWRELAALVDERERETKKSPA